MKYIIRLTANQYATLQDHLFPGDGLEAAALAVCGRASAQDRDVFIIRDIVTIPYDQCKRSQTNVTWSTRFADKLIAIAAERDMAIMKIHSHPGGFSSFSECDDGSDESFFRSVTNMLDDERPHASAVMLPNGNVLGRAVTSDGKFVKAESVSVVGEDIDLWYSSPNGGLPGFTERHEQVFGAGTVNKLRRMCVSVVGCSGTGSPLIEQLVRLGVGRIILIDPDRVEWRNLNRINMTKASDANLGRLKVDVLAEEIGRIGLGTEVIPIASNLETQDAVRAVSSSDLVFGCMDSVSGRETLNRLATFYTLPYIDVGVQLTALPNGNVDQITGAVHYLQPGRSSLRSRGVYDSEDVRAELLQRDDPDAYRQQLREKYIRGVQEDRPAVISVNTLIASIAVNEMLARIHRFRYDNNDTYASLRYAIHEPCVFRESESDLEPCPVLAKEVGRGDATPLLDKPELTEKDEP